MRLSRFEIRPMRLGNMNAAREALFIPELVHAVQNEWIVLLAPSARPEDGVRIARVFSENLFRFGVEGSLQIFGFIVVPASFDAELLRAESRTFQRQIRIAVDP